MKCMVRCESFCWGVRVVGEGGGGREIENR